MNKYDGICIPANLTKHKPILGLLGNIDSQVETSHGKISFHGTAMAVFQEKASSKKDDIITVNKSGSN